MKTPTSARELFRSTFKGSTNFLTREVVTYGWVASGRHAYEISRGEGMGGGYLYGVTIIDADGTHNSDLSEAVHSLGAVEEKLQRIRGIYRKRVTA